ncbi:MAG: 50S ribosomal protein L11 [Patescibacteria group bacterium]|nr:50S ribosomal protein L11 [Patescibacteria group bacterium]
MAKTKKVKAIVKLNIPAGKANPAPPVGPALGQHGVAIMDFCTQFNAKTKDMGEYIIPAVITIYKDRTFTFVTKTPPAANLLLKKLGLQKGSAAPNKEKIGTLKKADIEEIAQLKMKDLSARSLEQAVKIIEGTARGMGIEVGK